MYSQLTHPGNMPIRVLRYNIEKKINLIRSEVTQMLENEDINSCKEILLTINKEPLSGPNVNIYTNKIQLNENYEAYLWCTCYFFFIIQEHVEARLAAGNWDGIINYKCEIINRAKKLFEWACSLRDSYSEWDLSLPNPDIENSSLTQEEVFFIEKVNGIYTTSIVYLFLHEYYHISAKHIKAFSICEEDQKKEMEQEADNFAFDSIIKTYDNEQDQLITHISILMPHIGNFFLLKSPYNIQQSDHPDVDIRLLNTLRKLSYSKIQNADYVKSLVVIGICLFMSKHGLKTTQLKYNSFDDLIIEYENIFDNLKD